MSAAEAYATAFADRADDRPKASTLQAIRRVARKLGSEPAPPLQPRVRRRAVRSSSRRFS
eukprot:2686993-Prymnesium_polylepis.1